MMPKCIVWSQLPERKRQGRHQLPWTAPKHNPFKGLILCRVLPPRQMSPPELPPLLPYKCERTGLLLFPLCSACCERPQSANRPCQHSAKQRSWLSAYTHLELNKALGIGYQVLDVFEAEHYKNWASKSTNNGLFDKQIDALLKLKVCE